jgi:hypothetical protein
MSEMELYCEVCGAVFPNDIAFQELHMLWVHGMEV